MQTSRNFREDFGKKRDSKPPKKKSIDERKIRWSYSEEEKNIPIKKRTHQEIIQQPKKMPCSKKYISHCFMGADCMFSHVDDDVRETAKPAKPAKPANSAKTANSANPPNPTEQQQQISDQHSDKRIKTEIEEEKISLEKTTEKGAPFEYVHLDESCFYSAGSKQVTEKKLENGFCHRLNTLAVGCNIYSNLIGNNVVKKNLGAVYLCSELLSNLGKIEVNAIMLRCLLCLFPALNKLYLNTGQEKIRFVANDPAYKIEYYDSVETREEKLRIRHLDKLQYTIMVIAHQSSIINAIYKYNNYEMIPIFSSLINNISKHFIVDLYLQNYYSEYREPVTYELCEMILEENKNAEQKLKGLNSIEQEYNKFHVDPDATCGEGVSDESKSNSRYFQK